MTPKQFDDRYQRGLALLNDPDYQFIQFTHYKKGFEIRKNDGTFYFVMLGSRTCDCWDFLRNKTYCKHVAACEELLEQEHQIEQAILKGYIER